MSPNLQMYYKVTACIKISWRGEGSFLPLQRSVHGCFGSCTLRNELTICFKRIVFNTSLNQISVYVLFIIRLYLFITNLHVFIIVEFLIEVVFLVLYIILHNIYNYVNCLLFHCNKCIFGTQCINNINRFPFMKAKN